jgi:hypothetical protein
MVIDFRPNYASSDFVAGIFTEIWIWTGHCRTIVTLLMRPRRETTEGSSEFSLMAAVEHSAVPPVGVQMLLGDR